MSKQSKICAEKLARPNVSKLLIAGGSFAADPLEAHSADPAWRDEYRTRSDDPQRLPQGIKDVTFLRLPEVKALTGLSKTSLYSLIRQQSFPAPVHLSSRAVAWVRSEVSEWAACRILASRSSLGQVATKIISRSVKSQLRGESRKSA